MITPILARRNPDNAGERYVTDLIDHLQSSDASVTVIVPKTERNTAAGASAVAHSVIFIPIRQQSISRGGILGAKIDRLRGVRPPSGFTRGIHQSREARHALARADVLDIQWEETASVLRILKTYAPRARTIVTLHDVLTQRFARQATAYGSPQAKLAFRVNQVIAAWVERRLVRKADSIIVFSEKDRRLLPDSSRVTVVYPPAHAARGAINVQSRQLGQLLFVGPLWRDANYEGIKWFIANVLPRVRVAVPDAKLVVAGDVPVERRMELAGIEGLELAGFVESLDPYYAAASAVIAPLRRGAGVKFKVIDAISRGIPTIATAVAAEGIEDTSFRLIAYDTPDSFASAVIAALNDRVRALREAEIAAKWARLRYGRDQFMRRIRGVYGLSGRAHEYDLEGPRSGVTVVIPVRNGESGISVQLEALAAQTEALSIEVVISDNGSTDRTVEAARAFADCFQSLRIVDSSDKAGVSHARNVGATAARGRYLLFVDSDDAVLPGYISAMVAALDRAEMAGGVALVDGRKGMVDRSSRRGPIEYARGGVPYAIGCAMSIRRATLLTLGGFDESFVGGHEEVELALRARQAGFLLAPAPGAEVMYAQRRTAGGVYNQYRRYGRTSIQLWVRANKTMPLGPISFTRSIIDIALGGIAVIASLRGGRRMSAIREFGWRVGTVEGHIRFRVLGRPPAPVLWSFDGSSQARA